MQAAGVLRWQSCSNAVHPEVNRLRAQHDLLLRRSQLGRDNHFSSEHYTQMFAKMKEELVRSSQQQQRDIASFCKHSEGLNSGYVERQARYLPSSSNFGSKRCHTITLQHPLRDQSSLEPWQNCLVAACPASCHYHAKALISGDLGAELSIHLWDECNGI